MRAVVQRVTKCSVSVDGNVIGAIGKGLLVLLGIATGDSDKDADYLAEKIVNLRIFEDESGKLNLSVLETGGQILVVSQFTLLGDCRKGRRPSFFKAADPQEAEIRYQYFVQKVRESGITVQTGQFQALMEVSLVNYGPVTLILES